MWKTIKEAQKHINDKLKSAQHLGHEHIRELLKKNDKYRNFLKYTMIENKKNKKNNSFIHRYTLKNLDSISKINLVNLSNDITEILKEKAIIKSKQNLDKEMKM